MLNDARVSWTEQYTSNELKTLLYCLYSRTQDSVDYFILSRSNSGVICFANVLSAIIEVENERHFHNLSKFLMWFPQTFK